MTSRMAYIKVVRLSSHAKIPDKVSSGSAGFDLYSAYDYVIPSMQKALILTDIAIQIPSGFYGRIAPRSGLALIHSIDVFAGVIDSDYRGNIGVILFNFGINDFHIKKGDAIAQLILENYMSDAELAEILHLNSTERGFNGFGSSDTPMKFDESTDGSQDVPDRLCTTSNCSDKLNNSFS